jgi:hypothetical protein
MHLFTHGRICSLSQGWNNDNLENEMAIVFKVVEKIKSLIPPKD